MNNSNIELKKVFKEFPEAFINFRNELILYPKTNLYFRLDDINSELDLKCKILEWCSRAAYKEIPYSATPANKKYNAMILRRINNVLGTKFDEADIEKIYAKLGNNVNRKLCVEFILSDWNIDTLNN